MKRKIERMRDLRRQKNIICETNDFRRRTISRYDDRKKVAGNKEQCISRMTACKTNRIGWLLKDNRCLYCNLARSTHLLTAFLVLRYKESHSANRLSNYADIERIVNVQFILYYIIIYYIL